MHLIMPRYNRQYLRLSFSIFTLVLFRIFAAGDAMQPNIPLSFVVLFFGNSFLIVYAATMLQGCPSVNLAGLTTTAPVTVSFEIWRPGMKPRGLAIRWEKLTWLSFGTPKRTNSSGNWIRPLTSGSGTPTGKRKVTGFGRWAIPRPIQGGASLNLPTQTGIGISRTTVTTRTAPWSGAITKSRGGTTDSAAQRSASYVREVSCQGDSSEANPISERRKHVFGWRKTYKHKQDCGRICFRQDCGRICFRQDRSSQYFSCLYYCFVCIMFSGTDWEWWLERSHLEQVLPLCSMSTIPNMYRSKNVVIVIIERVLDKSSDIGFITCPLEGFVIESPVHYNQTERSSLKTVPFGRGAASREWRPFATAKHAWN